MTQLQLDEKFVLRRFAAVPLSARFFDSWQILFREKEKKNYHKHLEKSNYNSTGKKSRGKLLELYVRVKQKLASVRKRSKLQQLIHYLAPSERSRLQARNFSPVCRSFMEQ